MGSTSTIGTVLARLDTDNAAFDAKMAKSGEVATATSRMIEKASKQQAEAQAFAAKFAGDSINQQTLRIVAARKQESAAYKDLQTAQRLAKAGYEGEEASAKLVAAALQRVAAAKKAVADASEVEAKAGEHASVISQRQAASAAIRMAEGNPGIRATENFLTTIPGVGAALQAAFPVIGAIAFGSIIVEETKKVYDFIQTIQKMPKAIEDGFRELHVETTTETDKLRLTNDELANTIAKLEHRPENTMAEELDRARIKADELAKSLMADSKNIEQLLSQNHLSTWSVFLGKADTNIVTGSIKSYEDQFADLGYKMREAQRSGNTDEADRLRKEIRDKQTSAQQWSKNQLGFYDSDLGRKVGGDTSANVQLLEGFQASVEDRVDAEAEQGRNEALQKQRDRDLLKQQQADDARKAAAEQLKAMEGELNAEKLQNNLTLKQEYDFWEQRRSLFMAGSEQYRAIVAKEAELAVQSAKQAHEQIQKFREQQKRDDIEDQRAREQIARAEDAMAKDRYTASVDAENARHRISDIASQGEDRVREFQIGAYGTNSGDILRATAGIQAADYQRQAAEISRQTSVVESNTWLTGAEREKALAALNEQAEALRQSHDLQIAENEKREESTTLLGGANDALREFVLQATNAGAAMKQWLGSSLNTTNDAIVKAMTGGKADWGQAGHQIFTSATSSLLKGAEGSILSAFGLGGGGKKDGQSQSTALFVQMGSANGGGSGLPNLPGFNDSWGKSGGSSGASGGGLGGFLSSLFGGASAGGGSLADALSASGSAFSADQAAGGLATIGSDLTDLIPFAGGFADGGYINPDSWAIVGEDGPEPIFSGRSGLSVLPNESLAGGGGDTHNHTWNVDARGASDPAAVHAAVMRAAPAIAASAVKAVSEARLRKPSMRR